LAEKWWRKVFHRGLAGRDIAAAIQAKGMNTWEIAGGACASGCPRCTVERADEERQV
jgi:hypothetical protein